MSCKQSWTVGAADDCDILVNDPTVSSHHCRLVWTGDSYTIEDLKSTNGTFVNGQRIANPKMVTSRDRVSLGRKVIMPWPDGCDSAERVVHIGRAPDNDIVLDSPSVSAHHARIVVAGRQLIIEDLGSTNGTAITTIDNRITSAEVSLADTVHLGAVAIPVSQLLGDNGEVPRDASELPQTAAAFSPPELNGRDSPQAGPVVAAAVISVGLVIILSTILILSRHLMEPAEMPHEAQDAVPVPVANAGDEAPNGQLKRRAGAVDGGESRKLATDESAS